MKLGLIADVQYCDCEDDWNYERSRQRFYRTSLTHLDNALEYFQLTGCNKILQVGDLIDGRCRTYKNFSSASTLIGKRFESDNYETFHVTGNHELYNFSRSELRNSFIGKSSKKYQKVDTDLNYYKVNLTSQICLIVLDTYEISVLNRRDPSVVDIDRLAAEKILRENNKNESWNDPIGARKAKFVAFNGALGSTQLKWLSEQLTECSLLDNTVIISGHIPILSTGNDPLSILWNDDEVLEIIQRFPCVKAYVCGHAHYHEIKYTKQFIHLSLPGIIEAPYNEKPFGTLQIFDDKLIISDMPDYWGDVTFRFDGNN